MMGIGFWEMMLLAGIALVVIGPENFPDFAKVIIRTIRDLRGYMEEVKKDLADELKPVEKEMRSLTQIGSENLNQLRSAVNNPAATTAAKPAAPVSHTPEPSPDAASTTTQDAAGQAVAGTSAYGAYSPESDEDYDHSAANEGEDAPEVSNGCVTDVQPPERLDG